MTDDNTQTPKERAPFLDGMYLNGLEGKLAAADLDYRRLAFLVLMCVHSKLFLDTFPARGGYDLTALEKDGWLPKDAIPADKLKLFATHRDALIVIQGAWKELAEYEDPPCPPRPKLLDLVGEIMKLA